MHKLRIVLMIVVYLQVPSHHSVIPEFFQVAVLYKFDSTVFFLAMQEVVIQEAETYSRTSTDILDDAETKVLKSIKQSCIDWSCIMKPLNGPKARSHIRI